MKPTRKTLAALRERERRRTRDPVPPALLAKYLRVRRPPNGETPHRPEHREASGAKREE